MSINEYTRLYSSAKHFRLSTIEWKQVEYLIDITKLFNFFTETIGTSKEPTIGYAFDVYTVLFEHLYTTALVLKKKIKQSRPWVKPLVDAVEAAIEKLDIYFRETYNNLGSIYALGTILSPSHRLSTFERHGSWLNESEYWSTQYEDQFRRLYKEQYTEQSKPGSTAFSKPTLRMNSIALFMQQRKRKQQDDTPTEGPDDYEVDTYLAQGKIIVIFIVIRGYC
jgi:hypothetical protein